MAHKTLIGGTAYEISGGKTLVNGTTYNIKNGKTLVGGTAYEVGFGKPVTITITGDATYVFISTQYAAYAEIDGVKYGSPATVTVKAGTTITCGVKGILKTNTVINKPAYVYLNGEQVYSYEGDSIGSYSYTVQGDIAIQVEKFEVSSMGMNLYHGNLHITET